MPIKNRWLIYGAYGYSGELIARESMRRGLKPVLAGRDAPRVARLAAELGCRHRAFTLDDQNAVFQALEDVSIVLNCAGPFAQTAESMLHACLAAKAHYLDITGEIEVFEMAHGLDDRARRAGLVVCPGVGFDVVATDCIAAVLQDALPLATCLALGFDTRGGPSPGTARTMIRGLRQGGRIRSSGRLAEVALAFRERRIDFGRGPRNAVTIPWGDVSTAWFTTGIPNIEVYVPMPRSSVRAMRLAGMLRGLLVIAPLRRAVERRVTRGVHGPDEATRAGTPVFVWGEARDPAGDVRVARMRTANGYTFTAHAATGVVAELLARPHTPGYATPSLLMGAGYAASLPGSTQVAITTTA
jgi:short subunit dehydrogenase-like uncharacterized protein